MAKSNSMFEGKNAVQQSSHIKTIRYPNGNQGFSTNNLGGDTVPGSQAGAPFMTSKRKEVSNKKVYQDGANPFNDIVGDSAGVLGSNVKGQNAGQYPDSPVPSGAQKPNINILSKAGEVSGEGGNGLPGAGVLTR